MKKIIVFNTFLLFSIMASAQNELFKDTIVKPIITEIGKPDGEKVILEIGKEGGRLKSSDGKVELIFPAGALTENTNIIIQPVTNLAPNGSGKAYWFEPSGIQFKKPVQIIINYTDEEAEICPPDMMGLAIQNKQGQWSFVDYDSWDSTAKLLKGSITHFSGAANVNKMMIAPKYVRLKIRGKIQLLVSDISKRFVSPNGNVFYDMVPFDNNKVVLWYVNNIIGGNYIFGNIESIAGVDGNYDAPPTVPSGNPVTVKAEFYLPKKDHGGKTLNLIKTLTSKILIYDNAYEVKMESKQQAGNFTYKDNGSFIVSLAEGTPMIIEKINNNITDNLQFTTECTYKLTNLGANHGHIHITGIELIKLTPAELPNYPLIEITFKEAPMVYSTFQITCTDRKGKIISKTTKQANEIVAKSIAEPRFIKFLAKEGEQVIEDRKVPGGYYKVTVKKLEDD